MSTLVTSNISDGSTSVGTSYVVNGSAKAWCYCAYSSGVPGVIGSLNVSSVTDVGVGIPDFNFTSSFAAVDYATTNANQLTTIAGTGGFYTQFDIAGTTVSKVRLNHFQNGGTADPSSAHISCFGDLA